MVVALYFCHALKPWNPKSGSVVQAWRLPFLGQKKRMRQSKLLHISQVKRMRIWLAKYLWYLWVLNWYWSGLYVPGQTRMVPTANPVSDTLLRPVLRPVSHFAVRHKMKQLGPRLVWERRLQTSEIIVHTLEFLDPPLLPAMPTWPEFLKILQVDWITSDISCHVFSCCTNGHLTSWGRQNLIRNDQESFKKMIKMDLLPKLYNKPIRAK